LDSATLLKPRAEVFFSSPPARPIRPFLSSPLPQAGHLINGSTGAVPSQSPLPRQVRLHFLLLITPRSPSLLRQGVVRSSLISVVVSRVPLLRRCLSQRRAGEEGDGHVQAGAASRSVPGGRLLLHRRRCVRVSLRLMLATASRRAVPRGTVMMVLGL
jgi:hypothetical protein